MVQMNSGPDRDANVAKACARIAEAAEHKPDLVVIPEFFNIEYAFRRVSYDVFQLAEPEDGPSLSRVRQAARDHGVNLIATLYTKDGPGFYHDTAFVIRPDGEIAGKFEKMHPAGPTITGLERLYYRRGSGFRVFDICGWKVGISICYDYRFPETARCLALLGAELIVMPFASPYTAIWPKSIPTRAWENSVYAATCNKVGTEGGGDGAVEFPGDSMIADPNGDIIAQAGGEETIIVAELDRGLVDSVRDRNGMFRDRRPEAYGAITAP